MKNYIKVSGSKNANFLKIELDYSKGGYNYFTYKNEPRGYYIHVSPVIREDKGGFFLETYTAFSGIKDCILEVTRASKKAENQAAEIFEQVKDRYINYILDKYGLTLEV